MRLFALFAAGAPLQTVARAPAVLPGGADQAPEGATQLGPHRKGESKYMSWHVLFRGPSPFSVLTVLGGLCFPALSFSKEFAAGVR